MENEKDKKDSTDSEEVKSTEKKITVSESDNVDEQVTKDSNKDTEVDNIDENSVENKIDVSDEFENEAEGLDKNKTLAEAMDEAEQMSNSKSSDEDIDSAVDDIVRTESDEVIKHADEKLESSNEETSKKSFKQKVKVAVSSWWNNKPVRYGTFVALFVLLTAAILYPTTRYATLNAFGVRVSSSMTVIDSQTRLPLKNINVSLQDKQTTTNEDGYVEFSELKLGSSNLIISKRGYADTNKNIVLGWGSNPIGEQEIVATGEQFTFVLSDWQSNEPITQAEATAGENSARADDTGKIILTVGEDNIADVEVVITAENYRTETLTSDLLTEGEIKLALVPSRKHVFVSNRTGEYDIYKIDLDRKNEEVLLASTGNEREVPVVLQHPSRNIVAIISSRDGEENRDGFILDGLFIVNVDNGETKRIARSEQLQLLGWSGDKLVFWQIVEGTSKANPERSKIFTYDERTAERVDLASANYFNDIELVDDTLFYSVSSFAVPLSQAKLYKVSVNAESNDESQIVLDQQVWSIFRTGFDRLLLNAENQKWFEYVGGGPVNEVGQQPAPQQLDFVSNPDQTITAWTEVRDGKGVLLISNTDELSEDIILTQPGLSKVLYWVNDSSLVYRVITSSETADYFIDINKKEARKISDVTATLNTYF